MTKPTVDDRLRWLMYSAFEEGRASVERQPLLDHERAAKREHDYHERAEFEAQKIRELFARDQLRWFVRQIATGFDHDADAHRYHTFCQVCEAEKLLAVAERETPEIA